MVGQTGLVRIAVLASFGFAFFASAEYVAAADVVAMGDMGALRYSLSDSRTFNADSTPNTSDSVAWAQLTDEQKLTLKPLAAEWDTLRPWQREKMLDITRDYQAMSPEKQARIQTHLANWSRMTPYERENARKKYQSFNSLTPEKKAELRRKWLEYRKLPEAQREALRQQGQFDDAVDVDSN